jgi:hypothetical protein
MQKVTLDVVNLLTSITLMNTVAIFALVMWLVLSRRR